MNFIIDLSLNKRKEYIYNVILMIIDRYIKIIKYLLIIKKINILKLKKLLM